METAVQIGAVIVASLVFGVTILRVSAQPVLAPARARLIGGVPWGSLVTIVFVLGVYLILQRGFWQWSNPLVIPFRSWSYFYPTGVIASGFSHASPSHLLNNLTATAVLAPIAEYAWGHYPDGDGGRGVAESDPWYRRPWIRAFVLVPGVGIGVGLVTATFALGPVVGFSAVVFAYGGFAVVQYPVTTVVGLVFIGVVRTVLNAFLTPMTVAGISPGTPGPPTWATIAIQSHGLGFMIGVLLGLAVLRTRGRRPVGWRVGVALAIYGLTRGLWQVYRIAGNDVFVLYRAVGVALVLLLAAVVVLAVSGPYQRPPVGLARSWRSLGGLGVVIVIAALIGMAVPFGLVTVDATAADEADGLTIRDYRVTYTDSTTHQLVPAVDVGPLAELTEIEQSGLIVYSDQRHVWSQAASRPELAADGHTDVTVGGPTWQETVAVERSGWQVTGNETVYAVELHHDNHTERIPGVTHATAQPQIDNRSVTVLFNEANRIAVQVRTPDGATEQAELPAVNGSTTVGGLTIRVTSVDDRQAVVVERNGTRVQIAQRTD